MKTIPLVRLVVFAIASLASMRGAQYDQRLANLSTRAQVGTGDNIMITGFVIEATAPKKVLIRAVGSRLSLYSVPGVLANPRLQLFNSTGALVLENDSWSAADAATMTSVGAFALANNSADAALVATLSPGSYTAQISGVNNTVGVALLEIYDVTGSARLMNLSTRALVGTGANSFFSGMVVATGGGARRVLIRAGGPALTGLGIANALADPALAILDSAGRQIANGANDNWESAGAATFSAAAAKVGAFPFQPGSKDAGLVIDLQPGNYTIQVNGVGGANGVALVEVYDLSPEAFSTVSVTASVATTDTTSAAPAVFTFARVGSADNAVTANFTVGGTATAGVDYQALSGKVTFPAGISTATVNVVAKANPENFNNRTVIVTLDPAASYGVGTNDAAAATIFYNPGSLYVSNLRTVTGTTSTAYGTATIELSPDEKSAYVSVSFANLSSPEVVGHLAIDGNYVFNLPQGQVNGAFWLLTANGRFSVADLVSALKAGQVTVNIDTANYPAGELAGNFVKSSGSAAFNPPPAPPSFNLASITQQDAARFLTQATFGVRNDDVYALMAKGYNAWLNEQIVQAPSEHLPAARADMLAFNGGVPVTRDGVTTTNVRISTSNRQAAWWQLAVSAPDQLRQRMAFALSEIFVISDQNGTINNWQDGATAYYDLLVRGAFGNFRTLLEDVTLSPMMGIYLSSLRNTKAVFNAQGVATRLPDENYAREVMQLLTIGLNELQPDGSLRLDPAGQPIPTYTQQTIAEMAKVFTGWGYYQTAAGRSIGGISSGLSGSESYLNPMMFFPGSHDDSAKTIVGGRILPASQGGPQDLKDTLDALFNHPNTGPFIARQLIQRLVTSNPSPGYIYRVARAFANNGAGVRGDLGAVVRAILTDYEARSPALVNAVGFGKLKEPLIRVTALLRAFDGGSNSGRIAIVNPDANLGQAPLRSATVFNFFEPNYVLPGEVAQAGLYAPEFQITTDLTTLSTPNVLYGYMVANRSSTNQQTIGLNLTDVLPLAKTPAQLVDYMNLVVSAGSMPKALTDRLIATLTSLPANTTDLEKVRTTLYLAFTSPEAAIQK